ncbi:alpha/beta hydrolase [Paenibacillus aquistagni]|uniref:Esterase n=1 Tax=Paenibacillus aquistagni TaxID=1852522 RepID=A0A1X7L764_9BACL|nr:alpha/beta hydrolase-fold protein [Paenibacillus aquistagni]SMG48999.1 hypothetical protein SAMN06295960_3001 [Paenibacillus aquistagni]
MNRYHTVIVYERRLSVYLPPSYEQGIDRYPVAYVQDGGELFHDCANYLDLLFREKKLPELILIGIEPHNRNAEYTPWAADPTMKGFPSFGGSGRAYVDEVADTIKPFIDSEYRTLSGKEQTAILGGSFGGLISMFAGYWRPDTFGLIGMLSTSCWFQGVLDYVDKEEAPSSNLRIYMSVGSAEGIYKTSIQQHMVPNNVAVQRLWREKGFPEERLRFDIDAGGTHDAFFMTRRFIDALQWLFGQAAIEADGHVQSPTASRYSQPGTDSFTVISKHTGREYKIFVYVPAKPAPQEGYPILYALDGNAYFGSLAEAMRMQSRHPLGLDPGMIVGIGYDSDEPFVAARRFYDFTTQAAEDSKRPDGSPWPETGGAEPFLTFIVEELQPLIEARYSVDAKRRGLFGHSLGGLFTLFALRQQPAAFLTYVAGSPSIWWNGQAMLTCYQDWLPVLQDGAIKARLLLSIGSEEKPSMIEDAKHLNEMVQSYTAKGIESTFDLIEGEGHVSVIHPMISRMFRLLFGKNNG